MPVLAGTLHDPAVEGSRLARGSSADSTRPRRCARPQRRV